MTATAVPETLLQRGVLAGLNHVLAQNAWARQRLAAFAAQIVVFRCPPFPDLGFDILETGLLGSRSADRGASLTVSLQPAILPLVLARSEAALKQIHLEGSAQLAETVQYLFRHLSWDAEEDLSRLFGDVVAHRAAKGASAFLEWQREAAVRLGENLAEYWKEEQPQLVASEDVAAFRRDVQALSGEVDGLERRLQRLETPGPGRR